MSDWDRFRRALAGEQLPVALVDLDALEANLEVLLKPVRAAGKTLRLATKSVRSPALLKLVVARGGAAVRGLLTYSAAETAWLVEEGFSDLLLAYPTAQPGDAALVAQANARGAIARAAVDCEEHVALLELAAGVAGLTLPVVIDVDVAYRPAGAALHLGVRRSPLRAAADVIKLAERIKGSPSLKLVGLIAYEAQIAGLSDGSAWLRLLKRLSRPQVARARAGLRSALEQRGFSIPLFNGGGTGSVGSSSAEAALTEVAAGSGLLAGHLFDGFAGLALRPALYFALQVARRPGPGFVTCHGGGIIASGAAGRDRLPLPALPEGLRLLPHEGAGEVQTPLQVPRGLNLPLGAPVLFRPAKSGELAEHFPEYLLVRGERIVGRAPTYRGLGQAFLG